MDRELRLKVLTRGIRIFFLLVGILYLIYYVRMSYKKIIIEGYIGSFTEVQDYSNLFNAQSKARLKFRINFNSKIKNPISKYLFDDKYYIIVYKIDVIDTIPIMELIKEQQGDARIGKGIDIYNGHFAGDDMGENNFNFTVFNDSFSRAKNVLLTFDGRMLSKSVKNDSIIRYSFLINRFNIKYKINGSVDIQIDKKDRDEIKFDMLFLKRKNEVYLIMMSPDSSITYKLDDDEIERIIN